MSRRTYYTVYLRKTDEVVAFGDATECAKMLRRSVDSFYCTVNRNSNGRNKKYTIVKERI